MNAIPSLWRLGLVLTALATPLAAKDWSENLELKLRMGMNAGSLVTDLSDNKTFGMAIGTAFDLSDTQAITVELGFDYLPGRGKDILPASGTPVFYNQNGTVISSYNGNPLFLQVSDSNGSADSRRRSAQGISLRGGYRQAIPSVPGLSWQAGLSLDRYKSTNEFVGNIVPVYKDGDEVSNISDNSYEGWAYSRQRAVLSPGAYAGVAYQFQDEYKVEFNVRNVGVGIMNHTPLAYTGRTASFDTSTSRGFLFELSMAVKF